ncbi:hypothetical protein JCM10207_005565 [Rhodosporidiobolus poonsookiae]
MVHTPLSGPSRASTPSTAPFQPPLTLTPSPTLPTHSSFHSNGSATAQGRAPPDAAAGQSSGIRARRTPVPPADLTPSTSHSAGLASSPSSPRLSFDPDVTRPTLRRVTNDVFGSASNLNGGIPSDVDGDGYVVRADVKGKGKARSDGRRAVSEGMNGGTQGRTEGKDREVIVHELAKTDTIASISLQYGITPQALRASNRLWPSDPIFLRTQLLIPLDQCNLPSSSFGVERIAREENGDLTVWQRRRDGASASEASAGAGVLKTAAERAGVEHGLLSPTARRLASASAFELGSGSGSATPPLPGGGTSEFLDVWSSPSLSGTSSARPSLDLMAPTPQDSPVNGFDYLSATNNTFTSSSSPPPPTAEELVFRTVSPPDLSTTQHSRASTSASFSRPSSSAATSPPHYLNGSDASPPAETLSKRTLRIERLPASQLAFFPPASADPASPTKDPARNPLDRRKPPSGSTTAGTAAGGADESLFFGPLTNSLASSFSALGLERYLPSPFSSSGGGVALPPSPTLSRTLPRSTSKRSKWSLLDFGAEADEAGWGAAEGGVGLPVLNGHGHGHGRGAPPSASRRGSGVSGLGLTDSAGWASRPSAADGRFKPLPVPPPLPSPTSSPRQTHTPRGKKLRDSNEGVGNAYGAGAAGARAGARGAWG